MPLKDLVARKAYTKDYFHKWYEKNQLVQYAKIKSKRKQIEQFIQDIKSKLKCASCPENHISCIEFHHKDPLQKEISLSHAGVMGWGIQRILKEIDKCEVLCSNCHKKEHYRLRKIKGEV